MIRLTGKLLIAFLFLLAGCASVPSTDITGVWRARGHQPGDHVDQVIVIALVNDLQVRRALESEVVGALQARGLTATAALPLLGEHYRQGKSHALMAADLAKRGFQSALVISVLDIHEDMHFSQTGQAYNPAIPVHDAMGQGFTIRQNDVYQPGYFVPDNRYFLETNLYRLEPETLLWSAQTATVNPADLKQGSQDTAGALVERLARDDMI
ncbi:MAG: hypothetical protein R3292_14165 [Alcanivorax sp.]|nr:hypothetical protein [Alcanivorax sp.]